MIPQAHLLYAEIGAHCKNVKKSYQKMHHNYLVAFRRGKSQIQPD